MSKPSASAPSTVPGARSAKPPAVASARPNFKGCARHSTCAAGQGLRPLIRAASAAAGAAKSSAASSLVSLRQKVAAAASCATKSSPPASRRGNARASNGTQAAASLCSTSSAVSSGPMGTASRSATGPASSARTMRMKDTPVSRSPAATEVWIGEAPRYLGSSEAWKLIVPSAAAAMKSSRRMCP